MSAASNEAARIARARRAAGGLCIYCGRPRDIERSRQACDECLAKERNRKRKRPSRLRSGGVVERPKMSAKRRRAINKMRGRSPWAMAKKDVRNPTATELFEWFTGGAR